MHLGGQLRIERHGLGVVGAGPVGRDAALLDAERGLNGRACVVSEELGHLPLTREKPERVPDLSLEAPLHGAFARSRLKPRPSGDGRNPDDLPSE